MFKVAKKRVIEWPVLIQVPTDGGKVREHEVKVEFEDLAQSEQEAIYANGGDDVQLLKRTVTGWKAGEFKDESDNDILFSAEAVVELAQIAFVRTALITAYLQLHNGKAAARKN